MPNVNAQRILIFGDSLSTGAGSPGYELGANLARAGAQIHINSRIGRSAHNFWTREETASQLEAVRAWAPTMAIVELGTNDLGLNMAVDKAQMTKIRDELAHAGAGPRVYAFGPPAFPDGTSNAQAEDVVSMMRSVFGARFIDTRAISADMVTAARGRAGDGVHFTSAGGAELGARMAKTFLAMDGNAGMAAILAIGAGLIGWILLR